MENIEINRIIDQLGKLYSTNWAGVDIMQMLNEINDTTANKKLPFFTNTIHQIARHLIADNSLVIKRLQGINHQLAKEEDWIPTRILQHIKWSDTRHALIISNEELTTAIKGLSDVYLENPILKGHSTIYRTLHGNIQHAYYHFGQVSQIKKAIENLPG